VALIAVRALRRVDKSVKVPVVEIALLRSLPLFAPLPAPAIEGLAHALEPASIPDGAVMVRQGDVGDRFYVIAHGQVEVTRDGTHVADLGRGEFFGEIALLTNVPRTATVTARSDVIAYALQKDAFVTAVTGHTPVSQKADDVVSRRRAELAAL
jgi:CRP-like cAMP-binding protein